jgi:GTPase
VSVIGLASELATRVAVVRTQADAFAGQLRQIETVLAAVSRQPRTVTEQDVLAMAAAAAQAANALERVLGGFQSEVSRLS